jgi:hypothetical protein
LRTLLNPLKDTGPVNHPNRMMIVISRQSDIPFVSGFRNLLGALKLWKT